MTRGGGISYVRAFSEEGIDPYASIRWRDHVAQIKDEKGAVVFEQPGFRVPESWSDLAANVVAQKFAHGPLDAPGRESGADQIVRRVTSTIAARGREHGYFDSEASASAFEDDLAFLCLNQYGAFNSPVWFNVGVTSERSEGFCWRKGMAPPMVFGGEPQPFEGVGVPVDGEHWPQGSACFIQSVKDDMRDIMRLAASEAMLFKRGSGTGTDLSTLRSTKERLSGGGRPSGPVSFFKVYDTIAGIVKSGGKCLAYDQPVYTATGCVPARELAERGGRFVVLSYSNRLGRVAAKEAQAWFSGVKPGVEVVTDKGTFRVSHDHPFMLSSGQCVRADGLRPGHSLLKSAVDISEGYARVGLRDGRKGKAHVHRLVASDILGWSISARSVHHEDEDRLNNAPSNLRLMTQAEHAAHHGRGRPFYADGLPGERNGMHRSSAFWSDADRSSAYRSRKSAELLDRGSAREMQRAARRSAMLALGFELLNAGHDISTFEGYLAARKASGRRCGSGAAKQAGYFEKHFGSYEDFLVALSAENHRVVEVRPVGEVGVVSIEVFDDEPDDKRDWSEHNYGLAPIGSGRIPDSVVFVLNTRRAARMQTLKCWHPDILDFVESKMKAERLAKALVACGFDGSLDGEVYDSIPFQNTNISVRATDDFLRRALEPGGADDPRYPLVGVTDGEPKSDVWAPDLIRRIAECAHYCGDPGMQYEDTIQRWHTCPEDGPINSSNPCQPGFATVLTPDGIRTFDEIGVGSVIWSGRRWTQVIHKFATGVKPVYRYETTAGVFVGTEDHKVIQKGTRVRAADADAIDICVGPAAESAEIDPQDVVDGWVFGDGSVHRASNDLVYLNIGEKDGCFHDEHGSFAIRKRDGIGPFAWEVRTTIAAEEIPKTYDRAVPSRFKEAGPSVVRGFLRGLYAANGSVCGGRVTLKASSFRVIEDVREMLSSIGIRSYVTTNRPAVVSFSNGDYECKQSYDLNVTVDRGRFSELVGFVHPHKREKLRPHLGVSGDRSPKASYDVKSVVELGEFPVYDITVDAPEHTYWTGGLLVSNCSEYMFLDDSACNLASLNLMKFRGPDGTFDAMRFAAACRTFLLAQEILVDSVSYPTAAIAENSHRFRPLGLGYANLGALLMVSGLPYDSDAGRSMAAAVTSVMNGAALLASAEFAGAMGPYDGFARNREHHLRVARMHHDAACNAFADAPDGSDAERVAEYGWNLHGEAVEAAEASGFRNAQVTLLAPTGTIAFLMDCDTTGVEPDIALLKYKTLAGGGMLRLVNRLVPEALRTLGYHDGTRRLPAQPDQVSAIAKFVEEHGTVLGAPYFNHDHAAVFATAFGDPSVHWRGHVEMMAAVQPFLSGAISKTVNMPESATVEDIVECFALGWRRGLKALAVFRDNSKGVQPVKTSPDGPGVDKVERLCSVLPDRELAEEILSLRGRAEVSEAILAASGVTEFDPASRREKLPETRAGRTGKFRVAGFDGYVTANQYPDGRVGELFVTAGKDGSTVAGLLDWAATMFSLALQHGCPLEKLVEHTRGRRFEPHDLANSSIPDAVAKWLESEFLGAGEPSVPPGPETSPAADAAPRGPTGKTCPACGCLCLPNGSKDCYACPSCGSNQGACGG